MNNCFYYIEANIACIILMGIIIFNIGKGIDKQISTLVLYRMMKLLVIYFIADSVWIVFETGVLQCSTKVMYLLTIIPYACLLIASWLWFFYCELVQKNTAILTHKGTFKTILPLYIAIIILIGGIFSEHLFHIDENGFLEYGPLYLILLCGPFGYLLYSSYKAFHRASTSNRYHDHGLYFSMGLFPLLPLICGILQSYFLLVPILCFGATAASMFLYISAIDNRISTDPLTQINNRQEMERYLTSKMKSATSGLDLYLLILDVDHFKGINDTYGHVEGDKALVTVADAMRASCGVCRNRPFLSRYGGDEFIVIMEAAEENDVLEMVDSIRSNVTKLNKESGAAFVLEACIGYAKYDYNNPITIPQLIAKADDKLYEMKNARE